MQFEPNNKVVQLCAQGMEMESRQKPEEAKVLFLQAWNEASNDFEKFTAAHYVARHQESVKEKLNWDETALSFAQKINDETMKASYPSLYLNIAKCYEDLQDLDNAQKNYQSAFDYINHLPANSYGELVRSAIKNGIERVLS